MTISWKTALAAAAAVAVIGGGAWLALRMEGEPPAITFPQELARRRQVDALGVRRRGPQERPAPGARLGPPGGEDHAAVLRGLPRPRHHSGAR